MTWFCAHTKKIIPQAPMLAMVAATTLNEPDFTWFKTARKFFTNEYVFGSRERYLLIQFRNTLKRAPEGAEIGQVQPAFCRPKEVHKKIDLVDGKIPASK